MTTTSSTVPEYNVTGMDLADRRHFRYTGPLIDVHAHVTRTRPSDPKDGPPGRGEEGATVDQAGVMLEVARSFGVEKVWSMCPVEDIPALKERYGERLGFNAMIMKNLDDPDDAAYQLLDRFLEQGAAIIKFWAAPRGRDRGLLVDTPWRIESARRARAAGVRVAMVHVADPDTWFQTKYTDVAKYGTKAQQYDGLIRLLEMFPDLNWIGAHMGGDSEHPDHLEALLEQYPHLYFDTSATKWQVREVSARREAVRSLIVRHPSRFLFGSDLVTRHHLVTDHYVSRYWCQRTLWESKWEGPSPIADADFTPVAGGPSTPTLAGLGLPAEVLEQVYVENARRLLG